MTKDQIQSEISAAEELTSKLLAGRPNDEDLLKTGVALGRIRAMVARNWPLQVDDRKQINLGLYAVRALEGGPYEELPEKLMTLSAHLKEG